MGRIYDAMAAWFEAEAWSGEPIRENVLLLGFEALNGKCRCFAQAREEAEQVVFYSIAPVTASLERRPAVAEFITRANYNMPVGNFELDFADGEIRYKTSLDLEGTELTASLMRPLVYTNVSVMDRYLPGLLQVANEGTNPGIAIAEIEGIPGSDPE